MGVRAMGITMRSGLVGVVVSAVLLTGVARATPPPPIVQRDLTHCFTAFNATGAFSAFDQAGFSSLAAPHCVIKASHGGG